MKMNELETRIRKVNPEDAEVLLEIGKQTFNDTYRAMNTPDNMAVYMRENFTLDKMRQELKNEESAFFFAISGDQVSGYLKVNWGKAQTESAIPEGLEIERIYVLQEFHGRGIGSRFIDTATDVARTLKIHTIWLGVWEMNPGAIRFYERQGFRPFGTHIFTVGGEDQTDLMMKLEIT